MSRWNQASLNREQVVLFSPALDTPSVRRWRLKSLLTRRNGPVGDAKKQ